MKNNLKLRNVRFLILFLVIALFSMGSECEKAKLVEYQKYSSDADVPRISLDEAKKDYDAGTAVIVDARGDAAYKQEHITGSLNIQKEDKFSELPRDKKIIVYCS